MTEHGWNTIGKAACIAVAVIALHAGLAQEARAFKLSAEPSVGSDTDPHVQWRACWDFTLLGHKYHECTGWIGKNEPGN